MCNIAAYVGEKAAAPILFEMIEKQEGFAGGYYTGIATIHNGRIYYEKLMGDSVRLKENTNALNLPGNIGIIHSRSKSGGGDRWAHPFLGVREGKITEDYVANGRAGSFSIGNEEYTCLIKELIKDGFQFTSKTKSGDAVHMSDVMCQLIVRNISRGETPQKAIETAFCTMPNEIVGLLLSLTEADKIFYGRINRPMMLSFASHGAYLSTTAIVFPKDMGKVLTLPENSSGYVKKDSFYASPFEKAPARVGEINNLMFEKATKIIKSFLKEEGKTFTKIAKKILPLFENCDCGQNECLSYEVLRALYEKGEIEIIKNMVEGAAENIKAPQFIIILKEK